MGQNKFDVSHIVLAIILTAVIVGTGFYTWQKNLSKEEIKTSNTLNNKSVADAIYETVEPITYSLSGVSAQVMTELGYFDFTADQLESLAQDCGTIHESGYFNNLISKFSDAKKIIYSFNYTGATYIDLVPGPNAYKVTLLENKAKYSSLAEFKKDFNICGAGGDAYPVMLNSHWLLFENTCSGASGPTGCDLVREIIEPTLKLK